MLRNLNTTDHLTEAQRGAIVHLANSADFNISEVARTMGCHRSTVKRWLQRFDETGDVKRQRGSGRPNKITVRQRYEIVDYIEEDPITKSSDVIGNRVFIF